MLDLMCSCVCVFWWGGGCHAGCNKRNCFEQAPFSFESWEFRLVLFITISTFNRLPAMYMQSKLLDLNPNEHHHNVSKKM